MAYVIACLIILAILLGWVHSRKVKNTNNSSGCIGGCAGCPNHNGCGENQKK